MTSNRSAKLAPRDLSKQAGINYTAARRENSVNAGPENIIGRLKLSRSLIVTGWTGAGKSSLLKAVAVRAATHGITVTVADAVKGGADFHAVLPAHVILTEPSEIADAIRTLAELCAARTVNQLSDPETVFANHVLFVDEFSSLLHMDDRAAATLDAFGTISELGPTVGLSVVISTQAFSRHAKQVTGNMDRILVGESTPGMRQSFFQSTVGVTTPGVRFQGMFEPLNRPAVTLSFPYRSERHTGR